MLMFFPPMLLQYAKDNLPFDDPDYLVQLKLDGIRLLVSNMDKLRLYTKNLDATERFPELQKAPISKGTIIDCELIVTDERGHPDFEACLARFNSKKMNYRLQVCAFDILYYRGENVMSLPLERRLELLENDLKENDTYSRVRCFEGSAIQLFDIIKKSGLEGLVLKSRKGRYLTRKRPCEPGVKGTRSWDVQKVINYDFANDIRITGYSKLNNQWLIGRVEGETVTPLGSIELGVTAQHRKVVWPKLQQLIINETKQFVYVDPVISCNIKHRGYYKSGLMRLPVLESVQV
ncbi:DNA ligase [Paenibacillus sp. LHD-117]|uniref:ATP-dependent DNA ligase n=1 Tax=Paenibacillus sp. LHD-117 TaxID=3071412 RepID=UPI0027DF74AA|nr:DNA ligase [Paenibacillus sp. LHD-117]MDQ6422606.1 DNA ligase [Paenibacillus sp. LHD-117]